MPREGDACCPHKVAGRGRISESSPLLLIGLECLPAENVDSQMTLLHTPHPSPQLFNRGN